MQPPCIDKKIYQANLMIESSNFINLSTKIYSNIWDSSWGSNRSHRDTVNQTLAFYYLQ